MVRRLKSKRKLDNTIQNKLHGVIKGSYYSPGDNESISSLKKAFHFVALHFSRQTSFSCR